MSPFDVISTIPILKWVLRKSIERNLEVIVLSSPPPRYLQPEATFLTRLLDVHIRLINHRSDRTERIIRCTAKTYVRSRIAGWVNLESPEARMTDPSSQRALNEVELPPSSSPKDIRVQADSHSDYLVHHKDPVRIAMVFDMVGPMRRIERKLVDVRHYSVEE